MFDVCLVFSGTRDLGVSMLKFHSARLGGSHLQGLAICAAMLLTSQVATGQPPAVHTSPKVALVVEGRVEQVFRDGDQCLVQILVHGSEAPDLGRVAGIRYPAPGECVYAHVDLQSTAPDRIVRRVDSRMLPDPQSRIRAFLASGVNGRWEAIGRDWFAEDAAPSGGVVRRDRWPLDRLRRDRGADAEAGSRDLQSASLGIETELAFYNGEAALKVTRVDPDSPAQRSGIAPGLLILKADGERLASPQALREAERESRGSLQLEVVDPRERRERRVRVEL